MPVSTDGPRPPSPSTIKWRDQTQAHPMTRIRIRAQATTRGVPANTCTSHNPPNKGSLLPASSVSSGLWSVSWRIPLFVDTGGLRVAVAAPMEDLCTGPLGENPVLNEILTTLSHALSGCKWNVVAYSTGFSRTKKHCHFHAIMKIFKDAGIE
ncbi:hypothetical protein AgCh_038383 [Apium graveolens]